MSSKKPKREHEDIAGSTSSNEQHNPAIEDQVSISHTYASSYSYATYCPSRDPLEEMKYHKDFRRPDLRSCLSRHSVLPSPVEVAENMFPEEQLQKQIRVVVARHKRLRIMAMLQRLVVVLREFRENLEAVSQELEKREAKLGETVAQYESYVKSHSFLVKEMMLEQRQRRGGNVAEMGPGLS